MGMIHIKLSTDFPEWPLARQTPRQEGIWGDCRFFINEDIERSDFWVVYAGLRKPETTFCAPERVFFVAGEPPGVKSYHAGFLAQFHGVVTCQREMAHRNKIFGQQGYPWHVGRRQSQHQNISFSKNYDEFIRIDHIEKEKLLSTVVSSKKMTEGHRKRLRFIDALQARLGERIDVFGRGIREIPDKWDAIAPYRYHLVLENDSCPDYWTEKLADCYLGGALPIYYGCPNLDQHFSPRAAVRIDIDDISGSLEIVERTIDQRCYEQAIEEISRARLAVLNEYNLFNMLSTLCKSQTAKGPAQKITLQPEKHYLPRRVLGKLWRKLRYR